MVDNAWLTKEEKQEWLRSLHYAIIAAENGDEASEPVDLEFVPYLKRVNRIPWLVTTQHILQKYARNAVRYFKHMQNL